MPRRERRRRRADRVRVGALAKRSRDAVALLGRLARKGGSKPGLPPGGVPRRVEDGRRQGGLAPRAATAGLCGRARAGESSAFRDHRVAGAERRLGRRRGAREAGRTRGARVVVPPAVAAPRTVTVRAGPRGRGGLVGRSARRRAGLAERVVVAMPRKTSTAGARGAHPAAGPGERGGNPARRRGRSRRRSMHTQAHCALAAGTVEAARALRRSPRTHSTGERSSVSHAGWTTPACRELGGLPLATAEV